MSPGASLTQDPSSNLQVDAETGKEEPSISALVVPCWRSWRDEMISGTEQIGLLADLEICKFLTCISLGSSQVARSCR